MTPIFAFFALVFSSSFPINLNASATDRDIAARFAPVFYQAIGDKPRGDYITNFDFDGDWRGDNNWKNTDDKKFTLRGYIYYSVCETATHYFIHYAVFHPRDYKGGQTKGRLLSDIIREGVDIANKYDPTGLAAEATVAHENDMEGALVVVAKSGADLAKAWRVDGKVEAYRGRDINTPGDVFSGVASQGRKKIALPSPDAASSRAPRRPSTATSTRPMSCVPACAAVTGSARRNSSRNSCL